MATMRRDETEVRPSRARGSLELVAPERKRRRGVRAASSRARRELYWGMYRDPSSSMEQTIARLEAEIRDLRALGGRRREQRLIVATLLSVVFGLFALIACVDAREHETWIERLQQDETNRCTERLSACTSWAETACASPLPAAAADNSE
jgi:hypothetical protein